MTTDPNQLGLTLTALYTLATAAYLAQLAWYQRRRPPTPAPTHRRTHHD